MNDKIGIKIKSSKLFYYLENETIVKGCVHDTPHADEYKYCPICGNPLIIKRCNKVLRPRYDAIKKIDDEKLCYKSYSIVRDWDYCYIFMKNNGRDITSIKLAITELEALLIELNDLGIVVEESGLLSLQN